MGRWCDRHANGDTWNHPGLRRRSEVRRRQGWHGVAGRNVLFLHRSRRRTDELHRLLRHFEVCRSLRGKIRRRWWWLKTWSRGIRAAEHVRNAYRILAVRTGHLLPGHLRRDLKRAAADGAAELRQSRGSFLGILRRICLRRRCWRGKVLLWIRRRIIRWLLGGISSKRQPENFRRGQQHHALAKRTAHLLPGVGRIDLDHARTERTLHRHRVHGAEAGEAIATVKQAILS